MPYFRLWSRYTALLNRRPLPTRMVTSGVIFTIADIVSQQGFESQGAKHDWVRTGRLCFYGTFIFAPLTNTWLGILERIKASSKLGTIALRTGLDLTLWGSFIVGVYWTSTAVLEGKNVEQIKEKVSNAYVPALLKSWMVFGPAQIINFAFIPPLFRMLFIQSVGLGWNISLSYANNRANIAAEQKARAKSLVLDQVSI